MPPPPQSALVRQSTQAIVTGSQKSAPPRPQLLSVVQLSTQRWVGAQACMYVHCVALTHSTHALAATSQCWPFGQLVSVRQRTQTCVVVLQTPGAQAVLSVQPTVQVCVVRSH